LSVPPPSPSRQRLTALRAILRPAPGPRALLRLPPGTYRLTVRIFTGLFTDYDLHNVTSGYIAVPRGTPMFTGASLGEVARQISKASGYEHSDPADR
jgi:hypothetical protein